MLLQNQYGARPTGDDEAARPSADFSTALLIDPVFVRDRARFYELVQRLDWALPSFSLSTHLAYTMIRWGSRLIGKDDNFDDQMVLPIVRLADTCKGHPSADSNSLGRSGCLVTRFRASIRLSRTLAKDVDFCNLSERVNDPALGTTKRSSVSDTVNFSSSDPVVTHVSVAQIRGKTPFVVPIDPSGNHKDLMVLPTIRLVAHDTRECGRFNDLRFSRRTTLLFVPTDHCSRHQFMLFDRRHSNSGHHTDSCRHHCSSCSSRFILPLE